MVNAEYGQRAAEKNGSCNGNTLIMQACNSKITLDIAHQKRFTLELCSMDLKSCYDRVVHSRASSVMPQQNMLESACMCMFTTLKN
jgi:hypothetical protein